MRSKRFMTFRLPPKVDAARKLRCCDINFSVEFSPLRWEAGRVCIMPPPACQCLI